jgi:hypothetical protein
MTTADTTTGPAYAPPAIEHRQAVGEALMGRFTPSDPVPCAHFEK